MEKIVIKELAVGTVVIATTHSGNEYHFKITEVGEGTPQAEVIRMYHGSANLPAGNLGLHFISYDFEVGKVIYFEHPTDKKLGGKTSMVTSLRIQ